MSQSIAALTVKLVRLRIARLRERGLWPRPGFLIAIALAPVAVALLSPAPPARALPEICRMGPELGWRMAPPPIDAVAELEHPAAIYGRANWESGDPAPATTALFVVLARPDANAVLHRIARDATELEGQIYAACGLTRLDDPDGAALLARVAAEHRLVRLQSGCSSDIVPMDVLLTRYSDYTAWDEAQHDPSHWPEMEQMFRSQHNPPIAAAF